MFWGPVTKQSNISCIWLRSQMYKIIDRLYFTSQQTKTNQISEWKTKSTSTLEQTSKSGFLTSSKWSISMRTDALWCIYTTQFTHNLAAFHSEQHSVIVLCRDGKVQSCKGFVKEWFNRQHTNMSLLYPGAFGKGWRWHAVLKAVRLFEKCS